MKRKNSDWVNCFVVLVELHVVRFTQKSDNKTYSIEHVWANDFDLDTCET